MDEEELAALGLRVDARGFISAVREAKEETKQLGTAGGQTERQYQALDQQLQKVARDQQQVAQATGQTTAVQREAARVTNDQANAQRALGQTATSAEAGAARLRGGLATLAGQATGLNPALVQIVSVVGMLGAGSVVVSGVLLGVSAIGAAYRALTKDAREAREENEKYIQSLLNAERAANFATPGATESRRDATKRALQEAMDRRDRYAAASGADPVGLGFAAAAALQEREVQKLTDALRVQNRETKTAITDAGMLEDFTGKLAEETKKATESHLEFVNTLRDLHREAAALNATLPTTLELWERLYVLRTNGLIQPHTAFRDVGPQFTPMSFGGPMVGNTGVSAWNTGAGGVRYPSASYLTATRTTQAPGAGGGANWGQAAQIAGGMILGTGLAGDGYAAAGLGGALSLGAQGAMLGGSIAGPPGAAVGAVVGAVGGLVSGLFGHSKKVREEAERLRDAQKAFDAALGARRAALSDDPWHARAAALAAQHEKELAEARANGMKGSQVYELKQIQYEEKLRLVREQEAAATAELAQKEADLAAARERSLQISEDGTVRLLRAVGQGDLADRFALGVSQRRELANTPEADRPFVQMVQGIERQAFEIDLARRQQIEAIQSAAEAQLEALGRQEETARLALQTNQEQLRAQERTVESLRAVVDSLGRFGDSLKLSGLSPLTPQQRYEESARQVQVLASLARGGDVTAAASIPEAVRAYLEQSQRMFGTATGQYGSDFAGAQALVEEIRAQYAGRLTVEEKILAELQSQSNQLSHQINELQRQQDEIRNAAAAQIAEANRVHGEQMGRLWEVVRELLDIDQNTGATATNTGAQYNQAIAEVARLNNEAIPAIHSHYAEREQGYLGQIAVLYERIGQLENQLNGGWGGGGGNPPDYNPEDDPNWAGQLIASVDAMRRDVVNALESMGA